MPKANKGGARAFWSIDAAFALVLSVAMFAMFSSLLHAAGVSAARGAEETSGSLLSARFSSYALSQMENGKDADLQGVLGRTGRRYASLRVADADGEISFDFAGEKNREVYCTARIALVGKAMVRMEACIG
ncbi:MAG: hypothetical protein WC717_00265 [Candidatus Micrarchaeia archaeon]|jgi:hypothetical protein